MGPIQTAIGQMLGVAGGVAVAAKKMKNENERQARKEEPSSGASAEVEEKVKKSDKPALKTPEEINAEKKERRRIEVGMDQAMSEAMKVAQLYGIDTPRQLYFSSKSRVPLATSYELASVLSSQSLHNASTSKKRARDKVRARKQMLLMQSIKK